MIAIKGTIQDGQVVLPRPIELPDGTPVIVQVHEHEPTLGIREEDWPTTPEGIAALVAQMIARMDEDADLAAIQGGIDDMENERYRPVADFEGEFRERNQIEKDAPDSSA